MPSKTPHDPPASNAQGAAPSDSGAGGVPKVGVIYNPRSHRNQGQDLNSDPAPRVYVAQPGDQAQLPIALRRLAERGINLLVINGGDGTVRDVLTAGGQVFGDDWPDLAVLPKGKTNALTVDLDAPKDWSLQGAIDAYRSGEHIVRRPLVVEPLGGTEQPARWGFILGAGFFTLSINAGQDAHRLGAFSALAVGVTTIWTILQIALGSRTNKWRRGAKMAVSVETAGAEGAASSAEPLVYTGDGDPERRLLVFASTLDRFPAGIKPFGSFARGLKLTVLDEVRRTTFWRMPFLMRGKDASALADRGVHQLKPESFVLDLYDEFILDGEAYPAGKYRVKQGPALRFVKPASTGSA